jgi:hypothetical protein
MSNPDSRLFDSRLFATGFKPAGADRRQHPRAGSPALAALLAHLPGLAIAAALTVFGAGIGLPWLIIIVSAIAALLAWYWRLPPWWRYINLLFLPLLGLALYLHSGSASINPDWFLAAFLLLALTSIGAIKTRVPLYLSSPRAADELARRLPAGGRLIDLGCGLGGPLARIHKHRPDARLAGIEAAPLNWLITMLRLRASGARADIRLGNLWNVNLANYDIVYAYLSPAPMARLWDKALLEMKPGSLFISNTFAVADIDAGFDADEIVEIAKPGDLAPARLLIWRMR